MRARHSGPGRRVGFAAVGVTFAACAWAALTFGPAAADLRGDGWRTYRSESRGIEVRLPPGWHVAVHRLVPALINPRELISLGTGALPVGGGGNCGRYPEAALEHMRQGDRLISIQGSGGTPGTKWFRHEARWGPGFELGPLRRPAIRRRPRGPRIRASATYVRRGGHAYWVFVAFAGPAAPAARAGAERIVGGIRISG